jgi:hypothetical protein
VSGASNTAFASADKAALFRKLHAVAFVEIPSMLL